MKIISLPPAFIKSAQKHILSVFETMTQKTSKQKIQKPQLVFSPLLKQGREDPLY